MKWKHLQGDSERMSLFQLSIEKFMKEQLSKQFNGLVQKGLKLVSPNFQKVLTFLLAAVAIETQQLIIVKSFLNE